jgi:hypothetical protein
MGGIPTISSSPRNATSSYPWRKSRVLSAPAFAEMTLAYSTFGMRQTRFALRHVAKCFLIFDLLHFRGNCTTSRARISVRDRVRRNAGWQTHLTCRETPAHAERTAILDRPPRMPHRQLLLDNPRHALRPRGARGVLYNDKMPHLQEVCGKRRHAVPASARTCPARLAVGRNSLCTLRLASGYRLCPVKFCASHPRLSDMCLESCESIQFCETSRSKHGQTTSSE